MGIQAGRCLSAPELEPYVHTSPFAEKKDQQASQQAALFPGKKKKWEPIEQGVNAIRIDSQFPIGQGE
jgi:hypothetical protein